jgi:hypothetical protein
MMLQVADLKGLWRRSLVMWPDGRRDTSTQVRWLQGSRAFGDLRQPAAMSDFSRQDCARLAQQQGFAGHLTFDGKHFEWVRMIDFQPQGEFPDAGSLRWENDVLIEEGRDVEYLEHWHRESIASPQPAAAFRLRDNSRGITALLVRVGEFYIFARDRTCAPSPHKTLGECVAAAPTVAAARALVDCEISFCKTAADGVRVAASTLPFRVGQLLTAGLSANWKVIHSEGDTLALQDLLQHEDRQ